MSNMQERLRGESSVYDDTRLGYEIDFLISAGNRRVKATDEKCNYIDQYEWSVTTTR